MTAVGREAKRESVQLTISASFGPLFAIDELDAARDPFTREAATQVLQNCWPQLHKKHHGWMLSIEELEYLVWLATMEASGNGLPFALTVTVAGDGSVGQLRASLAAQNAHFCLLYRLLTWDHDLRLRHGSQFGAIFIGYTDIVSHGDILFFLGPLTPMEEVRAARVAGSAGKRAEAVAVDAVGGISRSPLGTPFADQAKLRKRRRKG